MRVMTFDEALKNANRFIVSPCCKTENDGFFTGWRVDRETVPNGWYAYDIRHNDDGVFSTINQDPIVSNHAGTFLTQTPLKFGKDGKRSLRGRGGYTFM